MSEFRWSRFFNSFPKNEVVAFYNALNMELFFLDEKSANTIINHFSSPNHPNINFRIDNNTSSKDVINHCINTKMLVPDNFDENSDLHEIRDQMFHDKFIGVMYMILTDGCNLKCSYCFEDTHLISGFSPSKMSTETSVKAIDTLSRINKMYPVGSKRELTIEFYGGEPLLNVPALQAATQRVQTLKQNKELPSNTELAMVTNATLVTDSVADFLHENEISVGVSIDGYEEVHNINRKDNKGKGSFAKTVHGYKQLVKKGVKCGVSCTLTPEVIQNFDKVLIFLERELGIKNGLTFNILHYTPNVKVSSSYYENAANCIIKAFPHFRDVQIWEDRMMRKTESFVKKQIMYSDCAAIGHQLVISPDGKIGVCQDFIKPRRYFENSVYVDEFDPYKDKTFKEWQKRSPLFMEKCIDCEALAICGGGCPASADAIYGSMWEIDQRNCPHSKNSLEWLIWDVYNKSN